MTASIPAPVKSSESESRLASQNLWQRYRDASDPHSESALIEQYLPLVKTIVGRLALTLPSHLDIGDLQSAGVVGLLHAVRHFDLSNGTSFETFARFRIRGEVLDELRRLDWASRTVREKARRIQAAIIEMEQCHSGTPNEAQIAAHLNISLSEYERWLDEVRPATFVCLDSVTELEEGGGRSLSETLSDPGQECPMEAAGRREMADLIAERIRKLPEMQRKVLSLYYYEDLRLAEIAAVFGVSESRICQIHSQAILTIRSFLEKVERGSEALRLLRT